MPDVVGLCHICGKPGAMHTCHLCGQLVCQEHYDKVHGICSRCSQKKPGSGSPPHGVTF